MLNNISIALARNGINHVINGDEILIQGKVSWVDKKTKAPKTGKRVKPSSLTSVEREKIKRLSAIKKSNKQLKNMEYRDSEDFAWYGM